MYLYETRELFDIRSSEKFLYSCKEIMDTHFDSFCSIKIKITTFDRLGFVFVQRCVVVKDVSVKERHFSDNPIQLNLASQAAEETRPT